MLIHGQALLSVDGVALAPHRPVDVQALEVDIYVSIPLVLCEGCDS